MDYTLLNELDDDIEIQVLEINKHLINDFYVDKHKVKYKESPVNYVEKLERQYTINKSKPLEIGYAARVTKFQKRADLLIPLMMELNKRKVNYHLNIAGNGNYFDRLKELVNKNELEDYISFYGNIPRDKMTDYWKQQDIFISVSDFEGASIFMLEAMSYGMVPIVTAVSGTEEYICDGENGFLCETRDIEGMSKKIAYMDGHRESLREFGNKAREIISKKAGKKDYINYINDLFYG